MFSSKSTFRSPQGTWGFAFWKAALCANLCALKRALSNMLADGGTLPRPLWATNLATLHNCAARETLNFMLHANGAPGYQSNPRSAGYLCCCTAHGQTLHRFVNTLRTIPRRTCFVPERLAPTYNNQFWQVQLFGIFPVRTRASHTWKHLKAEALFPGSAQTQIIISWKCQNPNALRKEILHPCLQSLKLRPNVVFIMVVGARFHKIVKLT